MEGFWTRPGGVAALTTGYPLASLGLAGETTGGRAGRLDLNPDPNRNRNLNRNLPCPPAAAVLGWLICRMRVREITIKITITT